MDKAVLTSHILNTSFKMIALVQRAVSPILSVIYFFIRLNAMEEVRLL